VGGHLTPVAPAHPKDRTSLCAGKFAQGEAIAGDDFALPAGAPPFAKQTAGQPIRSS
jgi:hypothetical protein